MVTAGALADYSTDLAYQSNYPYQDYNNYTYYSPQTSSRKRRVFTTDNPMSMYWEAQSSKLQLNK